MHFCTDWLIGCKISFDVTVFPGILHFLAIVLLLELFPIPLLVWVIFSPFALGLGYLSGFELGFFKYQKNAFVCLTKGICIHVWKDFWNVGIPKHLCCSCWWPHESQSCFWSLGHITLPHKSKASLFYQSCWQCFPCVCVHMCTLSVFLWAVLLYPCKRYTCIAESENQSYLKEALENNNLNQLFYFRSSGLVIVPMWTVHLCMSFSLLLLIKFFLFRTSSIYQRLATCETALVFFWSAGFNSRTNNSSNILKKQFGW